MTDSKPVARAGEELGAQLAEHAKAVFESLRLRDAEAAARRQAAHVARVHLGGTALLLLDEAALQAAVLGLTVE